jgi:trimethylamine--corrinoid protein Co-methyltransferase
MRPRFELLDPALIERVVGEALDLLARPGVKVEEPEAIRVLVAGGGTSEGDRVRIPEAMVRRALDTAPRSFDLYSRTGDVAVRYGQGAVHFDPGSSGVAVLDPDTLDTRQSQAADLVRITRVADSLPAYDAVSTAVVAHEVPTEIGDLYRLFLVMLHSNKPVVTGAFTPRGSSIMIDLLALDAGGRQALAEKPRAVFDVCPSPPQTMGEPASASWCRTIPASVSAACWTMDPMSVTGEATPASGMEISSAGTCARARSITLRHANSDQVRGGDGQTSNTARGFSARAARPPASSARRSIMTADPRGENAPVTTGLFEWSMHRKRR